MKKRILWAMVLVLLLTTLCACEGGKPKTEPKEDLSTMLEAYKAGDFKKASEYVIGDTLKGDTFPMEGANGKMFEMVRSVEYHLGEPKEEEGKVKIPVTIKYYDMSTVMEQLVNDAFDIAVAEGGDFTEERVDKMIIDKINEYMTAKTGQKEGQCLAEMEARDGKWMTHLEEDSELLKYLLGGIPGEILHPQEGEPQGNQPAPEGETKG